MTIVIRKDKVSNLWNADIDGKIAIVGVTWAEMPIALRAWLEYQVEP